MAHKYFACISKLTHTHRHSRPLSIRKRERNREAAKKCRQKKRSAIESLEYECQLQRSANTELEKHIATLRAKLLSTKRTTGKSPGREEVQKNVARAEE